MRKNWFSVIALLLAFSLAAPPVGAITWDVDALTTKSGPVINVKSKFFGAKGDGTTDDTAAIQAAIYYAFSLKSTLTGASVGTASIPAVYFPTGIYKVTGLNSTGYIKYFSDSKAVIKASDNGTTIFDNVAYGNDFAGLGFDGGLVQLDINTGGADSSTINVSNCNFTSKDNNTTSIKTTGSVSSIINVSGSKFYFSNSGAQSGQMVLENYCDEFNFTNNWVAAPATTFFRNYGNLYISGMVGVPLTGAQTWVENRGNLWVSNSRFGGESTSVTVVENYTSGDYSAPLVQTSLSIQDSIISSSASDYWLKFYGIPNHVTVVGNKGFYNGLGIWFDNAIPAADLTNFSIYSDTFKIENNTPDVLSRAFAGGLDNTETILFGYRSLATVPAILPKSALRFNTDLTTGYTVSGTGYAAVNEGNIFGNIGRKATCSSAGTYNIQFAQALAAMAKGMMTIVGSVFVQDNSAVTVRLRGAGQYSAPQILTNGYNTITHTFYSHAPTTDNMIGYFSVFKAGSVFTLGPLQVYSGGANPASINVVSLYNAVPTDNTIGGLVGDRVINSTPAVGQPKAWVCTVKGSPGTWVSEGNL